MLSFKMRCVPNMHTVKLRLGDFKNRVAGVARRSQLANLHASRNLKKVATHALVFLDNYILNKFACKVKTFKFLYLKYSLSNILFRTLQLKIL